MEPDMDRDLISAIVGVTALGLLAETRSAA